jgi:hypothetical protein
MKRKISLEKDFYNKRVDDLLYAQLLYLAEFDSEGKKLYLSKDDYVRSLPVIYAAAGLLEHSFPRKALNRKMKAFKDLGLVVDAGSAYIFPDNSKHYCLVETKMLQYLVNTGCRFAVQIYSYLAEAAKQNTEEPYMFTKTGLIEALGYSRTNKNLLPVIADTLEVLRNEKIIDWEEYLDTVYLDDGSVVPAQRMELLAVVYDLKYRKIKQEFVF